MFCSHLSTFPIHTYNTYNSILGRQNPLRLAVIRSELEIVRYLVEEKHVKPAKDVRVMCMAIMAEKKPKEAFRYLAQQGGDVNAFVIAS